MAPGPGVWVGGGRVGVKLGGGVAEAVEGWVGGMGVAEGRDVEVGGSSVGDGGNGVKVCVLPAMPASAVGGMGLRNTPAEPANNSATATNPPAAARTDQRRSIHRAVAPPMF